MVFPLKLFVKKRHVIRNGFAEIVCKNVLHLQTLLQRWPILSIIALKDLNFSMRLCTDTWGVLSRFFLQLSRIIKSNLVVQGVLINFGKGWTTSSESSHKNGWLSIKYVFKVNWEIIPFSSTEFFKAISWLRPEFTFWSKLCKLNSEILISKIILQSDKDWEWDNSKCWSGWIKWTTSAP